MIWHYKFLYNKNFYIIAAITLLVLFGCVFFVYQSHVVKNKNASILFYKSLSQFAEENSAKLEATIKNGVSPYSDLAKMHLAFFNYNSKDGDKDQILKIYQDVASNSDVLPIKDIALLYSSVLNGDFSGDTKIYNLSYKFFEAVQDIEGNNLLRAEQTLQNIISSLDANQHLKDLSVKLLRSCDSTM